MRGKEIEDGARGDDLSNSARFKLLANCLFAQICGGGGECCLKILHGVEGPLIKIAKGVPFSKNYFSKNGEKMGEKFRTNNKQRFRSNRDINLI